MSANRKSLLPDIALLLFGSLAFIHLMILPAFEDEGSQLRWVWRLMEAGDWRASLREGKPLEAWLVAPLALLGSPPLVAARALHVLAGMVGAVLTCRLALQLGDRSTAFVSGALFVVCPFVVYLQRLALSDIFLCIAGIWVLLSTVKLLQSPTWAHSAAAAAALFLAALCKLPVGFVFLTSLPLALLFMPSDERRHLLRQPELGKLSATFAPVLLLMLLIGAVITVQLRRGHPPGFGLADLIGIGMGGYSGIAQALGVGRSNLFDELTAQLSWPVVIIGLIGIAGAWLHADWRYRWLIAMGLMPMFAIAFLTAFWYPRYLLFTLPPLIVAAAAGWRRLLRGFPRWQRPAEWALLAVCVAFMGHQSMLIIFNPIAASWSPVDRSQYFEGRGSGYGYRDAARYLLHSPDVPEIIFSLDGHSAFQLLAYLPVDWGSRVRTISYDNHGRELGEEAQRLQNLLSSAPVWIIVPDDVLNVYMESSFGRSRLEQIRLVPIAKFDKPAARARLAIYEVTRRQGLL